MPSPNPHPRPTPNPRPPRGLSMLEVLLLVIILGIVGASSGRALIALAHTPTQTDAVLVNETSALSTLETMRSLPFDQLETYAAQYSTPAIRVQVALEDPTGGNNPNSNFKRITVTANAISLVTMVTKP